jgi:hypothetical protein
MGGREKIDVAVTVVWLALNTKTLWTHKWS